MSETAGIIRASLHVRGVEAVADRTERTGLVDRAAEVLERNGVRIVYRGRRTLTVEAEPSVFEEILGVRPRRDTPLSTAVQASTPELAELVDHLDIESAPLLNPGSS